MKIALTAFLMLERLRTHKKCSGVKGSLASLKTPFVCKACTAGKVDNEVCTGIKVGDDTFERVGKFCYLGDTINANGGAESASVARTRCAWQKFRELSPILTGKHISLKIKGRVYETCVRSTMLYGSETWAMKAEQETRFERTEMRMVRWMCGVSLKEKKTSAELRARLSTDGTLVHQLMLLTLSGARRHLWSRQRFHHILNKINKN